MKPSVTSERTQAHPFSHRLSEASNLPAFSMEGYWIWCASPLRDSEGTYHLFASRWSQQLTFNPHWVTSSEIVRATSSSPTGPYTFQEVVLPPRGKNFWDGRMTHNPTIHRSGDTFLLFYTGTTYPEDLPTAENPASCDSEIVRTAHANQRIGLAVAPSPAGPWTRSDHPILEPRPGQWDGLITTNPAPCVLKDGRVLLIYKSTRFSGDLLRFGAAMADHFEGPYRRLSESPILQFDQTNDHVEDAFVWQNEAGHFEMIMKDMEGGLGGEARAGVHAHSMDGIHWELSDPPQAYSRTIRWRDGTRTAPAFVERPQLLIEDGQPTHLFFAIGEGQTEKNNHSAIQRSWAAAIPLQKPGNRAL